MLKDITNISEASTLSIDGVKQKEHCSIIDLAKWATEPGWGFSERWDRAECFGKALVDCSSSLKARIAIWIYTERFYLDYAYTLGTCRIMMGITLDQINNTVQDQLDQRKQLRLQKFIQTIHRATQFYSMMR